MMRYATIVLLILAAGCSKRQAGKPRMGEVERLPHVETILLGKPAKLEVIRSYTATIEALEKAELCAMVKGYLQIVPTDLDIGRIVKKNDVLMTIYVPDLVADRDNKKALVEQSEKAETLAGQAVLVAEAEVKESQAQLQRHEAELEFRKVQLVRITRLAQGDTLSQQQVDEAKLQLNAAQAGLAAAQAQVGTKQSRLGASQEERQVAGARVKVARAELVKAEVQVEFANLRAPFDGVITKRWVDSGATVKDAGMPLFTVMRTDKLRVIIDVPERDAPYFRTSPVVSPNSNGEKEAWGGNRMELTIPALKDLTGSEKIQGAVTIMASALDPVTRTMRTEMHVDNKVGDKIGLLRPQMTGTAQVTLAVRDAFTVPSSALVRTGNKMDIFVVAELAGDPPRGVVKRVDVQIGIDDGQRVEIRNPALKGNELVIVRGAGVLRPGDQVITVPPRIGE